jgi:hypothetical protein
MKILWWQCDACGQKQPNIIGHFSIQAEGEPVQYDLCMICGTKVFTSLTNLIADIKQDKVSSELRTLMRN